MAKICALEPSMTLPKFLSVLETDPKEKQSKDGRKSKKGDVKGKDEKNKVVESTMSLSSTILM